MAAKPLEFLERLQGERPDLAEDVNELLNLYQKKLWHQLSVKLEESFAKPEFNTDGFAIQVYQEFIADFALKINFLRLSQFAVHVSKAYKDPVAAVAFLNTVIETLTESKLPKVDEPILFLRMHLAQYKLELDQLSDCKALLEAGKDELDSLSDVDPSVSAVVYYVSSLYYKVRRDYAEFYKSSLLYLSYVSSDSLSYEFKLPLAVDISLAALLGEHLYNFAQLLMHPIVNVLDNSPYAWLHELLECFNRGDLHEYDALCVKYAAALNSQPALVENERKLREKITLACLMELISTLPAENRKVPLEAIAERTKLSVDGVEFLLMKALSLKLIQGSMDQVEGTVEISWVQPKILTRPQIQGLKDRLDSWISKVNAVSLTLEMESIGVVEA